ncbi:MAG: glycosyltransferase [Muribaculaceae bacterium]|nr:glycosyltransferase [Muribaculaceae bacterium]
MRHNPIFVNTDVFIDYKNMEFSRELAMTDRPKIAWCHGSINFFNNEKLIKKLPMYDKLVCLTDSFVSDFKTKYPQYADRIVRIYNPIDCDAIRRTSETQKKIDGKYFVVVSRLDCDKDIETVIHAFDKFWTTENEPDIRLIIVGGGSKAKHLQSIANKLPSASNIMFTGPIPQPFGYMRDAIANILSSYNEGLPTVLIEAMAVGTLNISSDCPNGPAEILLNSDAGLLFAPGDTEKLSQIMSDIWNGRIDTKEKITVATCSLSRFNANNIINEIYNLIQKEYRHANR